MPTKAADIATFLKTQLTNLAANPGNNKFGLMFQDTHPFPFYTRYEYLNIDDLVDGLEWTLNAKSRVYTGRRYEYIVSPPVIANNANNELVYNFYATPGKGASSASNFTDNDSNYFNTA